jgi:CCR4-NOT transcription complex subunit 2
MHTPPPSPPLSYAEAALQAHMHAIPPAILPAIPSARLPAISGANSYNSDFPSLSGGPQPASNAGQSSWNSNILRQAPAQQQPQPIQQRAPQQSQAPQPTQQQAQQQQQQQQQQRVPSATLSQQSADQQDDQQAQQQPTDQSSGGGDEFPPLGVRTNGDLFEQANGHGGVTLRSPDGPDGSQTQGNGQQTQLPFREASNAPAQSQQAPIGHPLTQTTSQQVRISI